MMNVGVFRQKFRLFLGPDHVGGSDPFAEILSRLRGELVTIHRGAHLKSVKPGRPSINIGHP